MIGRGPAAASHSGNREHIGEHNNLNGISGGKPKNLGQVPVHGGMFHKGRDGSINQSVSATQVGSALHDAANLERDPLAKPPIGKRLSDPAIKPGQRSRTSDSSMHAQLGAAILHQALKGGGRS